MSKKFNELSESSSSFKVLFTLEENKISQNLRNITDQNSLESNITNLSQVLRKIDHLMKMQNHHEFNLRLEINGLGDEKSFLECLQQILNNSKMLEELGQILKKSNTDNQGQSVNLSKIKKEPSLIGSEIRNVLYYTNFNDKS